MSEYELLLDEAAQNGVVVFEHVAFDSHSDGLIEGDVIGLSDRLEAVWSVLARLLRKLDTTN